MFTNLSGKILPVAIIVAIVSGFGYWYSVNFTPPYNVTVTDVGDTSAAVVWETKSPGNATLYFSKNPLLIRFLPFTLPWVSIKKNITISVNHRIKLTNLTPGTSYSFAIGSGPYFYQVSRYQRAKTTGTTTAANVESAAFPLVQTLPLVKKVTSQGLIYGTVRDFSFRPIKGAVVVAMMPGEMNRIYSDMTEKDGFFGFYVPEATGSMSLRVFNGTRSQLLVPILWDKKIKPVTIALQ